MKKEEKIELLVNQIIGGQSMLFQIFTQVLRIPDEKIKRKELTYFSLSLLSFLYSKIVDSDSDDEVLEMVSIIIFEKILSTDDPELLLDTYEDYEVRYADEYEKFYTSIFENVDTMDGGFYTTLLMRIYEHVTDESAENNIIKITASSSLINQYIEDNIEFIKKNFPTK